MTVLAWDKVGERRFETGIDRGVLYPPEAPGVVWNGLVSVVESNTRSSKPYYLDGVKFLDHEVLGEYTAKLQAYTYPEELDALQGILAYAPGVFLHDQPGNTFGLSYRNRLGDDLDADRGYRLHLVYNVRAVPDDIGYSTIGSDVSPILFGWSLTSTPPQVFGIKPTAHISFDSRSMDPAKLAALEAVLYGTEETEEDPATDPMLPSILELLDLVG